MLKKTRTRENVLEVFNKAKTPLNANIIYEKLKDKNITLSSIYRTLETFTKEDILMKDNDPNGTAIYTLKEDNHSHYLECKNCHTKVKLHYCPYDQANDEITEKFDFQVDERNVVIYGTCKDCNKKAKG